MRRCPRLLCLLPSFHSHHHRPALLRLFSYAPSPPPASNSGSPSDDEWDQAWESAWLPDHLTPSSRAPWEADVHFPDSCSVPAQVVLPASAEAEDHEAKAFLEEMDECWAERRVAVRDKRSSRNERPQEHTPVTNDVLEGSQLSASAAGGARDPDEEYRLRKQRIHASLWMKEIERMEEAHLAGDAGGDIDRLLDSCAEMFNSGQDKLDNVKIPCMPEFKTKPDGWETTSHAPDGNIWEVTQREEGVLLQEFERRTAFSKFQIASFIKTHIFSRRRPVDGWKYMIEELGPNARKTKGSVQRLPALSDSSTQPFMEEKTTMGSNFIPYKRR